MANPRVVIIAGPNGAGKTTASRAILQGALAVDEFVNADAIAQGLSAFHPESAAMEAGRVMLKRLKELAAAKVSFGFETTLASRNFASWIKGLSAENGYEFSLIFFWLSSPEAAIRRVASRVRAGGHFVPDDTVRRRYHAGLRNFFELYAPIAARWRMYDNEDAPKPRLIAIGSGRTVQVVGDGRLLAELREKYDHA